MRSAAHNPIYILQFVNYLLDFSITAQNNRMIQTLSFEPAFIFTVQSIKPTHVVKIFIQCFVSWLRNSPSLQREGK